MAIRTKRPRRKDPIATGTEIGNHSLTTSELKRGLDAAGFEEGTEDWSIALRAGRKVMNRMHEVNGIAYAIGPNED